MKTIEQLVVKNDSAWNTILKWAEESKNDIEFLQPMEKTAAKSLLKLQITTKSVLGSVIYYTGGILINKGWLRVIGSGSNKVKDIVEWNLIDQNGISNKLHGSLLVAYDIVGGFFALPKNKFT